MGERNSLERTQAGPSEWRIPLFAIWILGAIALGARLALFPFVSRDATDFLLPWIQEFRAHGTAALSGEFSSYNFPYMFLLFVGSLLPLDPLFAIKSVSLVGDCLLALSVGAVVGQHRPAKLAPSSAALIALFLPTVLLNSGMWGQCDSFYTSFLLLSLRSLLRNDGGAAWLWWATAVSFKLQAVFFLPALALMSLRNRHSPAFPLMAAGLWVLLSAPPVLFSRPLDSTFSVYIQQAQSNHGLVAGAANIYDWFPLATADQGRFPAILLCLAALLVAAAAYWKGPDSADRRVLLVVTVVAICPLLLPQMHDRYFYAAEVTSLLLLGYKKLFLVPIIFAATGLLVYYLYFTNNIYLWPLMLAAIPQCLAVGILLRSLWQKDVEVLNVGEVSP